MWALWLFPGVVVLLGGVASIRLSENGRWQ